MEEKVIFNGKLEDASALSITYNNRGLNYGDALFETIRVKEGKCCFLEDHYFRLMASMRMLRMEIPMSFTFEFFKETTALLISTVKGIVSLKILVYRKAGGKYLPKTNEIDYFMIPSKEKPEIKTADRVDVYKDNFVISGSLSNIKHSNKLVQVLGSVYAKENDLDNSVLINEKKQVVEFNNGNLFGVQGSKLITPPLSSGCLNGIARKKLIEALKKEEGYEMVEQDISPFDLLKMDELFLSNAIIGIQSIGHYKKKQFGNEIGAKLQKLFESLQDESVKEL